MDAPDPLALLKALVAAHAVPHSATNQREAVLYVRYGGGSHLQHHALPEGGTLDAVDEPILEELQGQGYLDIDYLNNSWKVTPTPEGRELVKEHARVLSDEPVASLDGISEALEAQAAATDKLGWPTLRSVLGAVYGYWQAGGLSRHGVQLGAIAGGLPTERVDGFAASVQALMRGGYIDSVGRLSVESLGIPGEVQFTEKAHTVLSGWPGASPDELVNNLLAILSKRAAEEADPERKRRLEGLAESIRAVGVSTVSQVLSKVLLGEL